MTVVQRVGIEEYTVLLDRMRMGDEAAFTSLYRSMAPIARRAAQRIVQDTHVADDLVQEAFYLMLRAMRSGHGPTDSFRGYLVATVKRLAYKYFSAQSQVVLSDDDALYERYSPQPAVHSEQADLVASAWASLPPRWRRVLWLIEVDQYSPAELAPIMSMTANAISSLATRARRALRTAYTAEQHAEQHTEQHAL